MMQLAVYHIMQVTASCCLARYVVLAPPVLASPATGTTLLQCMKHSQRNDIDTGSGRHAVVP
jgi:hypothetical protein